MKVTKIGTTFQISVEGSVGEGAAIFAHDLRGATKVELNLEKLTYINSVGVKAWIQWLMHVPASAPVIIKNAPLVIVNQASTVSGFLPLHAEIESFTAPFICPKCDTESNALLSRGKDYEYATKQAASTISVSTVLCAKCRATTEPDFMPAKVFAFLAHRPQT
jgi:hypothetical protein